MGRDTHTKYYYSVSLSPITAATQAEVAAKANRLPFRRPLGQQESWPPAQDSLGIADVGVIEIGIELYIGRSRTDQTGEGVTVAIPVAHGSSRRICS